MSENQSKVQSIINDIYKKVINDVLWNAFKKNRMGDFILPFIVLRRLDCVLEPKKEEVYKAYQEFKDKVPEDKIGPILRKAAGGKLNFYNVSKFDLKGLTQDPHNIELNFNQYINNFSPNVRDILENFEIDKIAAQLVRNNLLFEMVQAMSEIDLHQDTVSNHDMGYIFEEQIRVANEQSNETAGEHFTPREVIRLMVRILFATEKDELKQAGVIRTIYDLACGTGGMLTIAKDYIKSEINPNAEIQIYGQEINEQSYAIAKSDLLITGENPDNIQHGNSFTDDKFQGRRFNYMLANPPYGVSWKKDERYIKNEALNPAGRFTAGLPRTSDGQFLFLQHMATKMDPNGARIAMVSNGSPLFTGDAGSGESEIRKWIITNDWLDAIIALPNDLFYNTGIFTYIWIVTNKKEKHRQGKVQLINATSLSSPMKRSLGNKRKEISNSQIREITEVYTKFEEGPYSKIYDNDYFGYFQVTVEQPLEENGSVVRDKNGNPKPDSSKRDRENIPLSEDIEAYFEKEIKPFVPNAWIDFDKTRIGYEINFTKYFYEYKKLRSLDEIKSDILALEKNSEGLLEKIFE
ncbi:MAG: N-6 DNA methylase [Bacteroidota bacterium]